MENLGLYFGLAFVMFIYHLQITTKLLDLEYELKSVRKLLVNQNKYLIEMNIPIK